MRGFRNIASVGTAFFSVASMVPRNSSAQSTIDLQLDYARSGSVPRNYKKIVDNYYVGILNDPDSRKIVFKGKPRGGLVCGTVNAKTQYGGYAGSHPFYAVFDDHQDFKGSLEMTQTQLNEFRTATHVGDAGYEFRTLMGECGFYG